MIKNAPAQLRPYYDIGKSGENDKERNWVASWYLRRSFQNAPTMSRKAHDEAATIPDQLQSKATPLLASVGRTGTRALSDVRPDGPTFPPPLTQPTHSNNKLQDIEAHRTVIDDRSQYAPDDSTSSTEEGEDVRTCQPPLPKRQRVSPASQTVATQYALSTPKHSPRNAADNMP